jgi:hypothetical protein
MPYPPPGIIDSIDQIAPTGAITSPAPGNVSGIITVSASASDYDRVASVQFQIDGTNIGGPISAAPYSVSYDTRALLNGAHTFSAIIRDRVGNSFVTSQAVTFANGPVVSITTPGNGANVSGAIGWGAQITSYDASVSSQFKVDGVNFGSPVAGTGAIQQATIDTRNWLNGVHTWSVVSTDGHGNSTTATITVTHVNNPLITITNPGNGVTVGGNVGFTATVTSYDASVSTQFKVDGGNYGAPISGAGSIGIGSVDTHQWLNGGHTISATVTDGHGNAAAASITVTFANAPVVTITSPGNGATLTGAFNFLATITSYDASVSTQFKVDGALYSSAQSGAGTLGYNGIDSRNWLNGAHTLSVTSTDGHGNTTTASISVTNLNNPVVQITSPGNGATINGVINFTVSVTSYDATVSSQLKIDGANFGAAQSGAGSKTLSVDTRSYLNGNHTYAVTTTDGHGNVANASLTVNHENAPVVTITSPGSGATINGNFALTATVTMYDASCSTQFKIDGNNYGAAQGGGGGLGFGSIDSHTLAGGGHTMSVTSTDGHGNTATASVSVTVGNGVPGGGKITLNSMMQWDGDQFYVERINVSSFDDRYNTGHMIWQATGDLTTPIYLPGNPDPTHYQMYIITNTDYTEVGTDGNVVYLDLMLDGGRYQYWQNGPLYGDSGSVIAVGGGNAVLFELYASVPGGNNCFIQGVGVRYWFGLKSGYQS